MSENRKAGLRLTLRLLGITLLILLVVFASPFVWSVLSPFIVALCIAASLQPMIHFAMTKLKMKRGIAVAIAVFLVVAMALLLMYWFVSFAVTQIISALNNAPTIINDIISTLQVLSDKLISSLEMLPENVVQWLSSSLQNAFTALYNTAVGLVSDLVSGTVNAAIGIPEALIYINFLLLAICFMTSGYDGLRRFFPGQDKNTLAGKIRFSAGKGMVGYVRVQLIYTLFVLAVSWVYLQVAGFQYSVLIAMLAALLELLPLFGNGTLYIPWVIICFILGDSITAIKVLILHLILYITRKVTEPRMMSSNMGLSPLMSLLTMYIGMKLGGVLGLTFAPVLGVVVVSAWHGGLFNPILNDYHTFISAVKAWLRPREIMK